MFSGNLNLTRFDLNCSICKVSTGSCIDCDYPACSRSFHVRCAINQGLILSSEDMQDSRLGEWDCKVFCQKHTKIGKKKL